MAICIVVSLQSPGPGFPRGSRVLPNWTLRGVPPEVRNKTVEFGTLKKERPSYYQRPIRILKSDQS